MTKLYLGTALVGYVFTFHHCKAVTAENAVPTHGDGRRHCKSAVRLSHLHIESYVQAIPAKMYVPLTKVPKYNEFFLGPFYTLPISFMKIGSVVFPFSS